MRWLCATGPDTVWPPRCSATVRELQERFLAEAQAGILKINTSTAGADISLPFGGWKASGVGPPEHGEADRLFYTRMQAVYGAGG